LENSKFTGDKSKIVINWGNSNPNTEVEKCMVINPPARVAEATNKLKFFSLAKGIINIPDFTTTKDVAKSWLDQGLKVVVREKLTGNSGEGIVMLRDIFDWDGYDHTKSKMYVKYMPKKQEYRIHVMNGDIILTQRKGRDKSVPDEQVNWEVRNHKNGFIFVKNEDKPIPDSVLENAVKAVSLAGLDFGAVDVVYNEYKDLATVLEINTAPGLAGTTGDTYIEALKQYVNLLGDTEERTPSLNLKSNRYMKLDDINVTTAEFNTWDPVLDPEPTTPEGPADF